MLQKRDNESDGAMMKSSVALLLLAELGWFTEESFQSIMTVRRLAPQ